MFGGYIPAAFTAGIFKFNPATMTAGTFAGHTLPSPRIFVASAWDPRSYPGCPSGCAYVFGGQLTSGATSTDIMRFDPTGPPGPIPIVASMPAPRAGAAAFFDGTNVYVVGGENGGVPYSDILRFNPMVPAAPVLAA